MICKHPKISNYSMWPPLAAITRSNRGRKLLQAFPTKTFLIDRHAHFTEALISFVLLWRVLLALSQFAPTNWNRGGSNLVSGRVNIFGPNANVGVQPALHSLRRVYRRSGLFKDIIWFLSDLCGPWENFRLWSFFVNDRG